MERVGHHDAVQPVELERLAEVGHPLVQAHAGKPSAQLASLDWKDVGIAVNGHDPARRAEQLGQRQGERPATGPEVRPARATAGHAIVDEPNVIGVVHGGIVAIGYR